MRRELKEILASGARLVSDGAMGTMLQAAGLSSGDCPELWNATNPEPVLAVHKAYIDAGCDILQTNTFGGTRAKLTKYGLEARTVELNRAGASLARKAAGDNHYVMASLGPTGEFIEPLGDILFEEAVEIYAEQAVALSEGGADVLLLETFSDLNEMLAALKGCRQADLPVFCTMSFDTGGRTMMGVSPDAAAKAVEEGGGAGIGANCGGGPEQLFPIAKVLVSAASIPVIIQPNAGLPELVGGQPIYPATPQYMADYARRFVELGVSILGGCCGTTPAHLAAIVKAVKGEAT